MKDQESSWMKMISKSEWASRIVLVIKLFFWTFCEKILRFSKIIGHYHLQMNESNFSWFPGF